ncbi:MAG: hypothetical protein E6J73_09100 [Deltaproteobacteria bacterium]|nr:MAG: hypothetical protein E6J73_09100 [Deltaproteobacteria bacterium]
MLARIIYDQRKNDRALYESLKYLQNAAGATPSPFDCFLTLRGLKTLALRMREHEKNAIRIAISLKQHPRYDAFTIPVFPTIRDTTLPPPRWMVSAAWYLSRSKADLPRRRVFCLACGSLRSPRASAAWSLSSSYQPL